MARKSTKKSSKGKSPVARPSSSRSVGKGIRSLTSSKPRRFVQRYYIDKFKRNGNNEWEIFTIEVRGTRGKPVKTKKQLVAKVKEIVK